MVPSPLRGMLEEKKRSPWGLLLLHRLADKGKAIPLQQPKVSLPSNKGRAYKAEELNFKAASELRRGMLGEVIAGNSNKECQRQRELDRYPLQLLQLQPLNRIALPVEGRSEGGFHWI